MPNAHREPSALPAPADRVKVAIIGAFSATFAGQKLQIPSRKAQALLGYLILANVPHVPRQRLMGLLWSNSSEAHARGSLRHALHEIQKGFREAGVTHVFADRLNAGMATDQLDLDLWQIATDAKAGKVHPTLLATDRLTDALLGGLDDVDPVFAEWLQETRAAAHTDLSGVLEKLLPPEDAETIAEDAEIAARALQRLSPGHERSARVLITARALANDLGTALQIYTALWKRLDDDFDIEPSEATQNLVARIRMEQPETGAAPLTTAASVQRIANLSTGNDARPSIAVLPFRPGSPDIESYFTSGIVDNVIHVLASFKELFVISRNSTLAFRDASPDLRAIGQTLGVRYILHGTVQRAGNRLRIQTELVDADKGEVVRTLQHNGTPADLFELQDQLAIDVVKAIAPYIRDRELKRALRKRPQDMTAYDFLLQALEPMFQLDYPSYSRARALLQQAMDADPTYASAFAYAAMWHNYRIAQEWSPDPHIDIRTALSFASKSIECDQNDALALAVYGYLKGFLQKDFATARKKLDEAIASSPNLPIAWIYSAALCSHVGEANTAIEHAKFALRLTPNDAHIGFYESILAQCHYVKGNIEAAIEWGTKAHGHNARLMANLRVLISALVAADRVAEAREYAKTYMNLAPTTRLSTWLERTPLNRPKAIEMVARMRTAGLPD